MGATASKKKRLGPFASGDLESGKQTTLRRSFLLGVPPEVIANITSLLDARECIQLLLTGDSFLRNRLEHGGITAWHLEARMQAVTGLFNSHRLFSFPLHHLLHLSLHFITIQEDTRLQLTPTILNDFPRTLQTLETSATLNLGSSSIDRFPFPLWGLRRLSCYEILIPRVWDTSFILPLGLEELKLQRLNTSVGLLPDSLKELHIEYYDARHDTTYITEQVYPITLPSQLQKLTWPFTFGQPIPTPPASLTWIKLGKYFLMDRPKTSIADMLPKSLKVLEVDFPFLELADVNAPVLPPGLERLILAGLTAKTPEFTNELVSKLPKTLKSLRLWYHDFQETMPIYLNPSSFLALPRGLTCLHLHTSAHEHPHIWSQEYQDHVGCDVNRRVEALPPTLNELMASHLVLDLAKLPQTLTRLSCMAQSNDVSKLPTRLNWLRLRVVHRDRSQALPRLSFPASLTELDLTIQPDTVATEIPRFPPGLNHLAWSFEGGTFLCCLDPSMWLSAIPKNLFSLELNLPPHLLNDAWMKSLSGRHTAKHLLTHLNIFGEASFEESALSSLPRTLTKVSLPVSCKLKPRHFNLLPPGLKKLHIHSNRELFIPECVVLMRRVPTTLVDLLLPFDDVYTDPSKDRFLRHWASQGIAIESSIEM